MFVFIGTALLLLAAVKDGEAVCEAKYADQTPEHTMCLEDSTSATAVTLSQTLKDTIVNKHNTIRAAVSDASNMQKMEWDDRLATVAEKWTKQCIFGHDQNRNEPDLPGWVGQNAARNQADFVQAVDDWAFEIHNFTYGVWTSASGHYIQQIFARASRIGCGKSMCNNVPYYACNYHFGTIGSSPYDVGTPCSQCEDHCYQDKLCDCTGALPCQHGQMNLATCQCDCPQEWSGADCSEPACPGVDVNGCLNDGSFNYAICACNCPYGYSGTYCGTCPDSNSPTWCPMLATSHKQLCDGENNIYDKMCPHQCDPSKCS